RIQLDRDERRLMTYVLKQLVPLVREPVKCLPSIGAETRKRRQVLTLDEGCDRVNLDDLNPDPALTPEIRG
ncbi:MAG TPA: hypothetical protein VE173_00410, partial [Longimicrobiales bacterium]|nr:hypothetical protein [Longimicrobiales bacterium]